MSEINHASREILWNVQSHWTLHCLYCLCAISVIIFSYGLVRHIKINIWSQHDRIISVFISTLRSLSTRRFLHFFNTVVIQKKLYKNKHSAIMHSLIMWPLCFLVFTTLVIFIHHDLNILVFKGLAYLIISLLADLAGLALLIGIWIAWHKHSSEKFSKHSSHTFTNTFVLVLLALLALQGFLLEGIRIASTQDPWGIYSPIGYTISIVLSNITNQTLLYIHAICWWLHVVTTCLLIAIIPYSNLLHTVTIPIATLVTDTNDNPNAMRSIEDLETIMTENKLDTTQLGITQIDHIDWKTHLELNTCTECGRCQDACPAYQTGKKLSPKQLIIGLKALQKSNNKSASTTKIFDDSIWDCTTCASCSEQCPTNLISPLKIISEARRGATLIQGKIPQSAQRTLSALKIRSNPFGDSKSRANWSLDCNVRVLNKGDTVHVLYWVGCIASYDNRAQRIAKATAKILNHAKIDWGILGTRELCTGDPARRLGDEFTYQALAKKNIETLSSNTFSILVASCPHCVNILSNEYHKLVPTFGKNFRIIHHSEYISELIKQNKIRLTTSDSVFTIHDPCYLRHDKEAHENIRNLVKQITTNDIKEMKHNKENSLCCGAGGGHYWLKETGTQRISTLRLSEANATSAKNIATACPFCTCAMEAETQDLHVKDISEIICDCLLED